MRRERATISWERVPASVRRVCERLLQAGYQAYLVGGGVRDTLLGMTPDDWDVATDARPHQVTELFDRTYAVGAVFGTVVVLAPDPVEVTTFRRDFAYADGRRPSHVIFAASIEEDLARRDFTMNAIAWDVVHGRLVDPYGGLRDLRRRCIRSVGDARERMREDALRMLRALRFIATHGFELDRRVAAAIRREGDRLAYLSAERIRDELLKLLTGEWAARALWRAHDLGILERVLPELKGAAELPQGKPGAPNLLAHLLGTVAACPPRAALRFAALLHDVGKLSTLQVLPGGRVIFHGHEAVGAEIARAVCRRLRMERRFTDHVAQLVQMHMVQGELTKKAIRRWLGEYGEAWVRDLIDLRRADHIASGGTDEENPFPAYMAELLEEVLAEEAALTRRDLAVNGRDVMERTGLPPGPRVGQILHQLFEYVLEDPARNERSHLLARIDEIHARLEAEEAESAET